jgi:hypothetical protein
MAMWAIRGMITGTGLLDLAAKEAAMLTLTRVEALLWFTFKSTAIVLALIGVVT